MIAKKVLKDTAKKNTNSKVLNYSASTSVPFPYDPKHWSLDHMCIDLIFHQDPFFEEVKTTSRTGKTKIKKQKKGCPPGLSRHDGDILMAVRRRAYWLDLSLFNLCGIRFGWSAIIGLFPG